MSLKKKFLDLKELLSKHNNAYYNATTLISDLEYDRLKSKYEKFLEENEECKKLYNRNKLLIDFNMIPDDIKLKINNLIDI